jgi:hypothetical protein
MKTENGCPMCWGTGKQPSVNHGWEACVCQGVAERGDTMKTENDGAGARKPKLEDICIHCGQTYGRHNAKSDSCPGTNTFKFADRGEVGSALDAAREKDRLEAPLPAGFEDMGEVGSVGQGEPKDFEFSRKYRPLAEQLFDNHIGKPAIFKEAAEDYRRKVIEGMLAFAIEVATDAEAQPEAGAVTDLDHCPFCGEKLLVANGVKSCENNKCGPSVAPSVEEPARRVIQNYTPGEVQGYKFVEALEALRAALERKQSQ